MTNLEFKAQLERRQRHAIGWKSCPTSIQRTKRQGGFYLKVSNFAIYSSPSPKRLEPENSNTLNSITQTIPNSNIQTFRTFEHFPMVNYTAK